MDETDDGLAALLDQERHLVFERFDNDIAIAIGLMLVDTARARRLPVTIDITRHGHQLFHVALPGTSPDNDAWIRRKNAVVERFGHSSFYVGRRHGSGPEFAQRFFLDPLAYSAHGGAFPILLKGTGPIGTITVSGLPQAEDHALVVEVLMRYLVPQ